MTENKDILGKLLNGKTTAGGVLVILVMMGLSNLGVVGRGTAATPADLRVILEPMSVKMYERTEQFQKTQLEIISNQREIISLLQERSPLFENLIVTQRMMLDEIKEMRRNRP
jgi:hypothetical protein